MDKFSTDWEHLQGWKSRAGLNHGTALSLPQPRMYRRKCYKTGFESIDHSLVYKQKFAGLFSGYSVFQDWLGLPL